MSKGTEKTIGRGVQSEQGRGGKKLGCSVLPIVAGALFLAVLGCLAGGCSLPLRNDDVVAANANGEKGLSSGSPGRVEEWSESGRRSTRMVEDPGSPGTMEIRTSGGRVRAKELEMDPFGNVSGGRITLRTPGAEVFGPTDERKLNEGIEPK